MCNLNSNNHLMTPWWRYVHIRLDGLGVCVCVGGVLQVTPIPPNTHKCIREYGCQTSYVCRI